MLTTETVAGAAGEASQKGMPQLNFATWPNQVFWLLVALVIIYIVLTLQRFWLNVRARSVAIWPQRKN